ncbi:DegT/DnrJ/EryC1/StrS family aminotransferase [Winogradskyella tangerina]|uniref:DegT/DnrJ/EryC1/StrS family aminotransferase n=1 Tax=Winogradskyella tangerina TaxID=2023240 RepID=UPI000DBE7832|nr:DegT/DnrJ/EryC1/StrS family aminotransferase [Winogradskyella tangerina]
MIKFLDLHKINDRFRADFEASFKNSLDTSHFILGRNVSNFENEFADYCGTKFAVGTANGLDALTLILKGYIRLGRLKKGDKVIVPANTFIATILSVFHADLEPIFVEPDPRSYCLSSELVEEAIIEDVKAIVMVHLYGQLADVEGLKDLAKTHDLLLIEDAAQAHGAISNTQKLKAGNLGDAAAFSFYPSKNLGALGDGGAITTSDPELYNVLSLLRNYGSEEKYKNDIIGYNSRLDDMQSAFLRIKLKTLDSDNEQRQHIAKQYLQGIKNSKINLPVYSGTKDHVFYAFVVEVEDRNHFMDYLDKNHVGWLIHYPIPPHRQKALSRFSELKLPVTEQIHRRVISLPMSPVLTDHEVNYVIEVLNNY